jgi:hypothetical protein
MLSKHKILPLHLFFSFLYIADIFLETPLKRVKLNGNISLKLYPNDKTWYIFQFHNDQGIMGIFDFSLYMYELLVWGISIEEYVKTAPRILYKVCNWNLKREIEKSRIINRNEISIKSLTQNCANYIQNSFKSSTSMAQFKPNQINDAL